MSFIDIPLTTSGADLLAAAIDVLTANGWTAQDGDPEVVLLETFEPAAENAAEVASQMPAAALRALGTLFGIPFLTGAASEAETTWTLVDDGAPHTIPAGTAVQCGTVFLQTVDDTDVTADTTTVANVLVRALDIGSDGNGATGAAQLVNPLAWVNGVTLTSTSSGGADAEADDSGFQDRLRAEFQSAGPPVTDADFAVKALDTPDVGVGRATAQTTDVRTVTVAVTDIDGLALTTDDKAAISAYLESKREVNFAVTVQDADYNHLAITYSFAVAAGYVASTVEDAINSTLRAFFNPALWGTLPASNPAASANAWSNTTTAYISVLTALIQNTQGVDHVGAGTVKINGSTSDFSLTGTAPLPSIPADWSFSGHTNTSTSITAIATSDTANLYPHMAITGPGIPANTVISSVSSTSIVISNAATATATVTLAATALIPTVL